MMVIGFSGKKGSGKTTIGEEVAAIIGAGRIDFADALKEIVFQHFGASQTQLFGTEKQKNEKLECGLTARQVMQRVGSALREIDPEAWVRYYEREVSEESLELQDIPIVTCDVRYPNEVEAIHRMGGKVIRLTREPHADGHTSETALDSYEGFDLVMDNRDLTVGATLKAVLVWLDENGIEGAADGME